MLRQAAALLARGLSTGNIVSGFNWQEVLNLRANGGSERKLFWVIWVNWLFKASQRRQNFAFFGNLR